MKIIGFDKLRSLCMKHVGAIDPISKWVDVVSGADWKNHNELKADFPSVDCIVNNRYVFNIRGDRYRLVVAIVFVRGNVIIRFAGKTPKMK